MADPARLDSEDGQDRLDVICMPFLAAGEALQRLEKLEPGLLFRDVIAHQYFDLDAEQVLLICQEALPAVLDAIRSLEQQASEGR